jgi:hypothetical protein
MIRHDKRVPPLLIGELAAATCINDDGMVYISLGSLEAGEEVLGIDEIEAQALHEWLGLALGKSGDASA